MLTQSLPVLTTQDELRNVKHEDGVLFQCGQCKRILPVQTSGGPGYGYAEHDNPAQPPICYSCCGENEKRDMIATGRATLYLSFPSNCVGRDSRGNRTWNYTLIKQLGYIGNWPATLKLSIKTVWHTYGSGFGRRYDVYHVRFVGPDGKEWYGRNAGDSQICRCHRLKIQGV